MKYQSNKKCVRIYEHKTCATIEQNAVEQINQPTFGQRTEDENAK